MTYLGVYCPVCEEDSIPLPDGRCPWCIDQVEARGNRYESAEERLEARRATWASYKHKVRALCGGCGCEIENWTFGCDTCGARFRRRRLRLHQAQEA